ncbi:MAG: DUF4124 domain-containing protein [Acidobacteria bacterium]|nr:DUF4124 domain-containing protein [Acidobacteriota bacterium]
MRSALLLLALSVLLPGQTQMYRWKDKKGVEHVTNTPPPPGATALEVPPAQNGREPGAGSPPAADPPERAPRKNLQGLSEQQLERWRALDLRLEEARNKKDAATIEAVVEGLFRESLWGSGLWALPLLPLATLAFLILLGWWIATGLRPPASVAVVGLAAVLGLGLAHLTLTRFLFRNQFLRLQSNLAVLEQHLGGRSPRPSNQEALRQHLQTLEAAARPVSPPWAFFLETRAAEDTMIRVALDP